MIKGESIVKLIASDYDGTFFTDETQLRRNIIAARSWREAGNIFGIITGRSFEMIQAPMHMYQIPVDFIVCNNGASVYDSQGRLLSTELIRIQDLNGLLDLEEMRRSLHYIFITTDGCFAKRLSPLSWIEDKEFKVPLIQSYEEIGGRDMIQISTCFPSPEEAAACAHRVNQLFGHEVHANLNQDCVDITPVGVDKRIGIEHLLGILPDTYEKILTIGDGENDITMLRHFNGATVEGAADAVKREVNVVYKSFEEMVQVNLDEGDAAG